MSLEPNAAVGVPGPAARGTMLRSALPAPASVPWPGALLNAVTSPISGKPRAVLSQYQMGDKPPKERIVGLRIGGVASLPAGMNRLRSTGGNASLHQLRGGAPPTH